MERRDSEPLRLTREREDEMLGADVFVAKTLGFIACQRKHLPCRLRELKVGITQCQLLTQSVWRRLTALPISCGVITRQLLGIDRKTLVARFTMQ